MLQIDPESLVAAAGAGVRPEGVEGDRSRPGALPASPGAACGQVVFTADDAVKWSDKGKQVLLVRRETCPTTSAACSSPQGILTATGGVSSHAALVARQMGKVCRRRRRARGRRRPRKQFTVGGQTFKEGD